MVSGDFEQDTGSWPTYRIGAIASLVSLVFPLIVGLVMLLFVGGCACCVITAYGCLACCKLCGVGSKNEEGEGGMPWKTKEYGWYTG